MCDNDSALAHCASMCPLSPPRGFPSVSLRTLPAVYTHARRVGGRRLRLDGRPCGPDRNQRSSFSKVKSTVALYSKYASALTFEKFYQYTPSLPLVLAPSRTAPPSEPQCPSRYLFFCFGLSLAAITRVSFFSWKASSTVAVQPGQQLPGSLHAHPPSCSPPTLRLISPAQHFFSCFLHTFTMGAVRPGQQLPGSLHAHLGCQRCRCPLLYHCILLLYFTTVLYYCI